MTLIAAMRINEIPIILGDLLISRETMGDSPPNVSIPSRHQVNSFLGRNSELQIVGLSQKVNIIAENFCLAWTGRKYQARSLIRHLHEQCRGRRVTVRQFSELLDQYPADQMSDLQCIAYLYDVETRGFWTKERMMPMFSLDGLEGVQVGGSGTERFIQTIESIMEGNIEGEYTSLEESLGRVMSFTSMAFGNQVMNGEGIEKGWGGGFEVAYLHGQYFEKLSDVMYLFWTVEELNDGVLAIEGFPQFIKSSYQGDRLRILVCDWSPDSGVDRLYVVDPLFDIDKSVPVEIPNTDYKWLINFFYCKPSTNLHGFAAAVNRFGSGYRPIQIEVKTDRYEIKYSTEFIENLFKQVIGSK
ncbi:hypothetical protein FE236_03735 [Mariprofundus erugo]|uniref:hypothetical protein n=1 Tax=Mariprofundus erugo TaxID=2528639 RepID=UPI0010FE9FA6|nr:hypothetical protein [Mariprofundus erugo]TLS77265.1 hypothetical protein FE236_03735 [Mariprofundus erugo]